MRSFSPPFVLPPTPPCHTLPCFALRCTTDGVEKRNRWLGEGQVFRERWLCWPGHSGGRVAAQLLLRPFPARPSPPALSAPFALCHLPFSLFFPAVCGCPRGKRRQLEGGPFSRIRGYVGGGRERARKGRICLPAAAIPPPCEKGPARELSEPFLSKNRLFFIQHGGCAQSG